MTLENICKVIEESGDNSFAVNVAIIAVIALILTVAVIVFLSIPAIVSAAATAIRKALSKREENVHEDSEEN